MFLHRTEPQSYNVIKANRLHIMKKNWFPKVYPVEKVGLKRFLNKFYEPSNCVHH